MVALRLMMVALVCLLVVGCGSLEKKSALINPGDSKETVMAVMGPPGDRQFQGKHEVWQYGQTGAGFGYHDYRMIWFYDAKVTGITSYKNYTPASSASAHFRPIRWEEAPDYTVEVRQR